MKQGREVLHFLFASFNIVALLTLDVQLLPMHVVYARLCQQLTARGLPIIRTESSCIFSAIYFNRWTGGHSGIRLAGRAFDSVSAL